ncbi:hypothetical protein [Corynebacterium variabile]|uniref:hypothetical protein n=1 Tax=Corynebacterium variabile TaxID=1727 RepID=UPI0011D24D42|nr:hypothetical protein [Corynebacterium variabile]
MGSEGVWFRIDAVFLVASLQTGLMTAAALTGEQLRAFGLVVADQRRHRITLILITLIVCVISFGVDAVVIFLSGRFPWWCLGVAALLSLAALVLRVIPSGASGDDRDLSQSVPGRTLTATAVSSGLLVDAVRRQFFRVVKTVAVLVLVQMMVRILLPGIAGTVMSTLVMVVGMTAIATGAALSGTLTSVMVFGGSRKQWSRTVLRDGSLLPLVGLLGAAVAMGMEKVFVDWLGWADPSLLGQADGISDVVFILLAGTASGVIMLLVAMLSALVDRVLPGWASIIALMVGAAAVVGLMYLVWPAGADAWVRGWWALTGGLTVCVVGGIGLAPMLTQLVSRCSLRKCNDMAAWYGFRTQDAVQA